MYLIKEEEKTTF